jgi:acetyl-CoA acetyltransferase
MGRTAAIAALREVAHPDYEGPFGAFVPALYALVADRHMHEFGTTPEHLAHVAVQKREHAQRHPSATVKDPLTVDDVLASKMVSTPLHLYDCCLVTDFSAGLVVTTAERAAELDVPAVYVLGYAESHSHATLAQAPSLTTFAAVASGQAAFAAAGVGPAEMDFAQLYDCFTITVLVTLEDLGFCAKGEAGDFVAGGALSLGGALPTNTNGGMLSYSTGGMFHVTEAVSQLRGQAGDRQVAGARLGVVNGVGGILSANCTAVLGTEETRS